MFFYSNFKLKKWRKLPPGKRQQFLQRLENKQAYWQIRDPLPVIINTDPEWYCYGMFEVNNGKGLLKLNISLITNPALRFHAMETIFHEGRHAYQYEMIRSGKPGFFNFKAKRWLKNWKGYVSAKEDATIYGMQDIERDAQIFTIRKLNRLKNKYRKEEDFEKTFSLIKRKYEKAEENAKEKYGMFYKLKIQKQINAKSKKW